MTGSTPYDRLWLFFTYFMWLLIERSNFAFLLLQRCLHEAAEQRMRAVRAGLQLRVRLRADEPGMLRQLDHLYDAAVRGLTGQKHAVLLKNLAVIVVDFIAVTMALVDDFLAVELIGLRG